MGFEPTTLAVLELCAVSYQLDHRDCLVARGSLNPLLAAGTGNDYVKFVAGIKNINFGFTYTPMCVS